MVTTCEIVELRRYSLQPGARETLIELFDRELVETQEQTGMDVLGQFRDLDDPDSFVWLRGFDDMQARRRALEDFYGGVTWKAHAAAANATMVDVDNVLLLHPLQGLELDGSERPAPDSAPGPPGLVTVTIYPLREPAAQGFADFFARELEPTLGRAGISVLATYATEDSENTFPALPVREDAEVFLWLSAFADEGDHAHRQAAVESSSAWLRLAGALDAHLDGNPEALRLTPTPRSLLRG